MTKDELMKLVVSSNSTYKHSGGQTCGILPRDVILELEGQIKVEVSYFRSMVKNKLLAHKLMEFAIDELLNNINK
jgi:hypothetical protein